MFSPRPRGPREVQPLRVRACSPPHLRATSTHRMGAANVPRRRCTQKSPRTRREAGAHAGKGGLTSWTRSREGRARGPEAKREEHENPAWAAQWEHARGGRAGGGGGGGMGRAARGGGAGGGGEGTRSARGRSVGDAAGVARGAAGAGAGKAFLPPRAAAPASDAAGVGAGGGGLGGGGDADGAGMARWGAAGTQVLQLFPGRAAGFVQPQPPAQVARPRAGAWGSRLVLAREHELLRILPRG